MFFIDWKEQTMLEIDCQYRGLHEIVRFTLEIRIDFDLKKQVLNYLRVV